MSIWKRLEELENRGFNPEIVRYAVAQVKRLGTEEFKVPPYDLPADSFITLVVLEIISKIEETK